MSDQPIGPENCTLGSEFFASLFLLVFFFSFFFSFICSSLAWRGERGLLLFSLTLASSRVVWMRLLCSEAW